MDTCKETYRRMGVVSETNLPKKWNVILMQLGFKWVNSLKPMARNFQSFFACWGKRSFPHKKCGFLGGIFLTFFLLGFSSQSYNGFPVEHHAIPLDEILSGGPPKDGIPSLDNPQFVQAKDADFLDDKDRILGISRPHQAKAYPIKILNWHEIVNDTLGNLPIVMTYCPLCGSGIGFKRIVGTKVVTFGVSGLLYQSDLLMYDHQTNSLWSQMAMKAVTGDFVGQTLTPIFVEHTTWEDWRQTHPESLVLSIQTGHSRNYDRDPYAGYSKIDDLFFPVGRTDGRFPPKEWVLGVEVNGKFKAYPFMELRKTSGKIRDKLNGQDYVVWWDPQSQNAKAIGETGFPLPAVQTYWFAWAAFHPETEVFVAK